ncbi:MAG: hypothetical protein FJ098_13625 [Deltaproteobacteria bacterium]|nr:hypothetical protein [Deltaproteobacteria bacterium]
MVTLEAGWACADLSPSLPFPLAGIVTPGGRTAARVLDPTRVTGLALRDRAGLRGLVAMDLLVVDPALHREVEERARNLGYQGVFLQASHTHSGMGGTIDRPLARLFMGRFRPELRALLLERITRVLAEAQGDLAPVREVRAGAAKVPGLTMNRRRTGDPTDDRVLSLELHCEGRDPILLWSMSGHPVAVAFREPLAESADYPGRVNRELTARGLRPLFVLGAVGGLNALFPEFPVALEDHLDLLARLAMDGLDRARAAALPDPSPRLTWARQDVPLRRGGIPRAGGSPAAALHAGIAALLGYLFAAAVAPREVHVPVILLGIGPVGIVGIPADFGVRGVLRIREALGPGDLGVAASHANGFVGYVHLPEDYTWSREVVPAMFHYENAMGWYGRDTGRRLVDAAVELARARPA